MAESKRRGVLFQFSLRDFLLMGQFPKTKIRRVKSADFIMLAITQCKKVLGEKARDLTDEQIEAIRDQLYIAANLAFTHWQKNCSSTKAEELSSLFAGEQPAAL